MLRYGRAPLLTHHVLDAFAAKYITCSCFACRWHALKSTLTNDARNVPYLVESRRSPCLNFVSCE